MVFTVEGARTAVAVIIQISGKVDGDTAPELARVCRQWITPTDKNLVLDFADVQYISSAGLGSVLTVGKEMSRQSGQILICGLTSRLKQVFTFSGFEMLFPFFDNREAALAACASEKLFPPLKHASGL